MPPMLWRPPRRSHQTLRALPLLPQLWPAREAVAVGRCEACYRYLKRSGYDRPLELVERRIQSEIERELERKIETRHPARASN